MPNVPLPEEPVGEFTVFRPFTAPGLFAYRHMQALSLLDFPDYGGGVISMQCNDVKRYSGPWRCIDHWLRL